MVSILRSVSAALVIAFAVGCSSATSGTGTSGGTAGADGGPSGPPADLPPGSVPADLAGTWAGARDGVTERLIFNADGSGSWESTNVTESTSCFSFKRTLRSGNVAITDTKITVYASRVVEQVQECKPPTIDTNLPAATEELAWHRHETDANIILIIDSACAAKYPNQENCNTAGCPIGLYCTSRLTRE